MKGIARDISPSSVNRIVCYCKDCQAFANQVEDNSTALNEFGGTEIMQIPLSHLDIKQGMEHVACLQLKEKRLLRWYTNCCGTLIGNTVGIKLPFVGVIHAFVDSGQEIDAKVGAVLGSVYLEQANGDLPVELKGKRSQFSIMLRILRKLLLWKVQGKSIPNPFFDKQGNPAVEPVLVE